MAVRRQGLLLMSGAENCPDGFVIYYIPPGFHDETGTEESTLQLHGISPFEVMRRLSVRKGAFVFWGMQHEQTQDGA